MKLPIYFDYASTTPADPRVVKKMQDCLSLDGNFGNPASVYRVRFVGFLSHSRQPSCGRFYLWPQASVYSQAVVNCRATKMRSQHLTPTVKPPTFG